MKTPLPNIVLEGAGNDAGRVNQIINYLAELTAVVEGKQEEELLCKPGCEICRENIKKAKPTPNEIEAIETLVDDLLIKYFDTPTGQAAEYVDIADIRSLIYRIREAYTQLNANRTAEMEIARKEAYATGYAQCCADNNLMTHEQMQEDLKAIN